MTNEGLIEHYRISASSLENRRTFISLTSSDVNVLASLLSWAKKNAAEIAREFYEHQFTFPPTRAIFDGYSASHGLSIEKVREHLEVTQANYQKLFHFSRV